MVESDVVSSKQVRKCRHPKEKLLFALVAVPFLIALFGFLGWWAIDSSSLQEIVAKEVITSGAVESDEDTLSEGFRNDVLVPIVASPVTPILIALAFFLLFLVQIGKIYGNAFGNGVKLSPKQYPEVHEKFSEMAASLGFKKAPDIFLENGNGQLNAFACTVPAIRDVVVIYSDIFERTIATKDYETLYFILGHELGHIKLKHTKWWYLMITFPLNVFPGVREIFGQGISRAREYGCDKVGQVLTNDETGRSLMILAAGKHNYSDIDLDTYEQEQVKRNVWVNLANFFQSHPIITWRIAALRKHHHGGIWFRKK